MVVRQVFSNGLKLSFSSFVSFGFKFICQFSSFVSVSLIFEVIQLSKIKDILAVGEGF